MSNLFGKKKWLTMTNNIPTGNQFFYSIICTHLLHIKINLYRQILLLLFNYFIKRSL